MSKLSLIMVKPGTSSPTTVWPRQPEQARLDPFLSGEIRWLCKVEVLDWVWLLPAKKGPSSLPTFLELATGTAAARVSVCSGTILKVSGT